MLQSPPFHTSSSLPLKLESSCWFSTEADVRTRAKTTPLSGSCFFCDVVPDYLINTHLKMWPPPGTLTEAQFPDTVPTTNLFAGDGLQENWPQPHSRPVFSFPFQATLKKCSLITEYQRERFCNHSNLLSSFTSRKPNAHSDKVFSTFFFSFHKVSCWKGLKTLLSHTYPSLPGIIFFAMLLWTWKTGFMKLSSPTA